MKEQMKLSTAPLKTEPKLLKPYSKGPYNKKDDTEQWIRISEGCPNFCGWCCESFENGSKPIYYEIPQIERNQVKILDMNLIYKPKALEIINHLGQQKVDGKVVYYELTCGIDYRYLTKEIAIALKENRFINIRVAWDRKIQEQKDIKDAIELLKSVGYKSNDIMIFMICNHLISSYKDNCFKLELCKIWGCQVHDAYFDNQLMPNVKPIHWTIEQIKDFRHKVRKHNQMVNFKIDPELD